MTWSRILPRAGHRKIPVTVTIDRDARINQATPGSCAVPFRALSHLHGFILVPIEWCPHAQVSMQTKGVHGHLLPFGHIG